jgi:flagellar biosynthetic protein FliR
MELLNLLPGIYAKFAAFILIATRIGTLLWTFNIFRRELITGRIVFTLTALLSCYVLLLQPNTLPQIELLSTSMLLRIGVEFFVGMLAGFILNIVFEVFLAVGQLISTQIGLSMASMYDPRFGSITTLSHFYIILTTLIFFLINGHLYIINAIVNSFTVLPVDKIMLAKSMMSDVLAYSSTIFSGSIMLSISLIITILLTNIAVAVMTKFAPQFNVFSIGINLTLVMGLVFIYATFNLFVNHGDNLLQDCLSYLSTSLQKLK